MPLDQNMTVLNGATIKRNLKNGKKVKPVIC